MSIERRVQLVEKLFQQLEGESALFKQSSGISCVAGCGKCCTHSETEASPLEFLPWAFHLFLTGEAENTLDKLNETTDPRCIIYKPLSIINHGRCKTYKYRGLICRLFGFAASTDKYGKLRVATCETIKTGQNKNYISANEAINKGLNIPVLTEYYMQLNQIDFHLGNIILPINKALKMALEEVLQYYAYRSSPELNKNYI